jgi:hypothetical protein
MMLQQPVDEIVVLLERNELKGRNAVYRHNDGLVVAQASVLTQVGLGLTERESGPAAEVATNLESTHRWTKRLTVVRASELPKKLGGFTFAMQSPLETPLSLLARLWCNQL